MSKQISAAELAVITHSLLLHPERTGELDTKEKYQAFMTELAQLICSHCGGEVQFQASKSDCSTSTILAGARQLTWPVDAR